MRALLVSFLLFTGVPQGAPPASFAALNDAFRRLYAAARTHGLRQVSPILIAYSGDRLVLLQRGERLEASYVTPEVGELKAVAHAPLAVYAALLPRAGLSLDAPTRLELEAFARQLRQVGEALPQAHFSAEQCGRQRRIVARVQALVQQVLTSGQVDPAELDTALLALRADVYANVHDAARALLAGLHEQMKRWQPRLDAAEFAALHVVVVGSHMARTHEATLEYFLHVLGEAQEGGRVIFAEGLWEESDALRLLATHLIDASASRAFFDDPMRLHRDVLSDATLDMINELGPLR